MIAETRKKIRPTGGALRSKTTLIRVDQWEDGRLIHATRARTAETLEAWTGEEALRCLRKIESERRSLRESDNPWRSGWIGFISYDLAKTFLGEMTPSAPSAIPLLRFHRVKSARPANPMRADSNNVLPRLDPLKPSDGRRSYIQKIRRIQEDLRQGNAYEVNLSRRWEWTFRTVPNAAGLFDKLSRAMRPRFGYLDPSGGRALMSFSPELFFSVRGRDILAEPIKGTSGARDRNLARSEKDQAELLMITDLFRNDFGKVCVPGSIRAAGPFEMRLPYARHLFSRIQGRLTAAAGLPDLIRALFPSGSVTGAPKIAACRIIGELEDFSREEAFGAVGWVGKTGMEFSVAIRTALLRGRTLRYTAGGGITVYSDPAKEYEETLIKARRFIDTLG